MREIKFRGWDTEKKEMFFPNWLLTSSGMNIDKMEHPEYGELHRKDGTAILMQFIGLKDKYGKEIYEGDIIDSRYGQQIVSYSENHCGFIPFAYPNNAPNNEESEVIGNIYENPELIKKGG